MIDRRRLPNRRRSEAFEFDHNGISIRAQISRFEDGSIGEIFLDAGKTGTGVQVASHDAAVAASLALQFGCDAGTLSHALMRLADGSPAGPLAVALDLVQKEGAGDGISAR